MTENVPGFATDETLRNSEPADKDVDCHDRNVRQRHRPVRYPKQKVSHDAKKQDAKRKEITKVVSNVAATGVTFGGDGDNNNNVMEKEVSASSATDDETVHGSVVAQKKKKQKQNVLDEFTSQPQPTALIANASETTAASSATPVASVAKSKDAMALDKVSESATSPPVAEQRAVVGAVSTTNESSHVCYMGDPNLHPDSLLNHPEFQRRVQIAEKTMKKICDLKISIANRAIRMEQRKKCIADKKAEWARLCVEVMMPVLMQTE